MIQYIERKKIKWRYVNELLTVSRSLNQLSNFGPVSIILQNQIHNYLSLNANRSVIVCSSGTAALHCLVEMYHYLKNKELKWATSNFTFPCAVQGPLKNSTVIDCDSRGNIPIETLSKIDFDGLLLTDLFGMTDREPYRKYCEKYKKILLIDSAMGFDKPRSNNDDEIISFHHTKPWGFGEGGCAIIAKKHESIFRSIINFGLVAEQEQIRRYSTNAKLSDIASAFILQRLKIMPKISKLTQIQYERISKIANSLELEVYTKCPAWTPPCVPILSKFPTTNLTNPFLVIKKYYTPLDNGPNAEYLYNRILNVPCHPEVKKCSDKQIKEAILSYIGNKIPL